MTDQAALIAAVVADPDSDLPRLVYADWLDDRGKKPLAVRAEFIRLQVAAARLPTGDPERAVLESRAGELVGPRQNSWLDQLPKIPDVWWSARALASLTVPWFDRGFPAYLAVHTVGVLVEHATTLSAATPIRHIGVGLSETVRGADISRVPPNTFQHVWTLDLHRLDTAAVGHLTERTDLAGLRQLVVYGGGVEQADRRRLRQRFGRRLDLGRDEEHGVRWQE